MVSDRQAHNLSPPGFNVSRAGNHLRRIDCPRGPRAARNDTLVATCESLRWCQKRSVFEYSGKRLGYRTTLSHLLKSPTTLVRSFSVCSARSPSAATQILRLRAALSTRFFAAWSCCAASALADQRDRTRGGVRCPDDGAGSSPDDRPDDTPDVQMTLQMTLDDSR